MNRQPHIQHIQVEIGTEIAKQQIRERIRGQAHRWYKRLVKMVTEHIRKSNLFWKWYDAIANFCLFIYLSLQLLYMQRSIYDKSVRMAVN